MLGFDGAPGFYHNHQSHEGKILRVSEVFQLKKN